MLQNSIGKNAGLEMLEGLTCHAIQRMNARSISSNVVENVLTYGRISYIRGATICSIGRKEIEKYRKAGVFLRDCEGVHVVCSSDQKIITVYRNRDFKGLRPSRRCAFSKPS